MAEKERARKSLRLPKLVNLELTRRCNLKCSMCFAHCQNQPPHPPLGKLESIIDRLEESGVEKVKLFGGEFLVYPHWRKVVKYIRQKGLMITFTSNGTLIDQETAQFLKRSGVKEGRISIHGPPQIHDKITGAENSFNQAIRGIKICQENDIKISIVYTLSQLNLNSVTETAQILDKEEILRPESYFRIGRLCPHGQTKAQWAKDRLSLTDYLSVFEVLEELNNDLPGNFMFSDSFPLCKIPKKYHRYIIGCWQGENFAHICSNGDVKTCPVVDKTIGNLIERPLAVIWQEDLAKFHSFAWLPEKCQACSTFCGGGCLASGFHNQAYGPDEFLDE